MQGQFIPPLEHDCSMARSGVCLIPICGYYAKPFSSFQGLTSLSIRDSPISQEDLTDQDLCPFLSETKESIFQDPMDEILWRVIKCHLPCLRISETEHAAMQTKSWLLFHVTFYEILKSNPHGDPVDLWPSGELHSDHEGHQRKSRRIRESALTVSPESVLYW
jgi:hypothetical protein